MSEVLTQVTQQYQHATAGWYHALFPVANKLFGTLAVIELAWSGLWWAIERHEVSSLWGEFLRKIFSIAFFYTILLNAEQWIPAILKSFMKIGSIGSHQHALYPSDVFNQGLNLFGQLTGGAFLSGLLQGNLAILFINVIAGLLVVLSFVLIAAILVVSLIEAYVVVGAGVLLLGFSSNQWTRSLAMNYLNYAVSVGVKLFLIYMIIGVGSGLAAEWQSTLIQSAVTQQKLGLEIMGGALIFAYVAVIIPGKASQLVTGVGLTETRETMRILAKSSQMTQGLMRSVVKSISSRLGGGSSVGTTASSSSRASRVYEKSTVSQAVQLAQQAGRLWPQSVPPAMSTTSNTHTNASKMKTQEMSSRPKKENN